MQSAPDSICWRWWPHAAGADSLATPDAVA